MMAYEGKGFDMRKQWTDEEVEFLKENVGKYKLPTLASMLGRTEDSVLSKMKRLGISNTKEQVGLCTIGELARLLGVDRKIVQGWVERHGLRVIRKVPRSKKHFYFVDTKDFWNWAKENKEKIDFRKIEPNSIPPEPDWVEQERKKNSICKKRVYKKWTTKEDRQLQQLVMNGLSYKEIGKILGRSSISVERRFKRLQY
jgi:transposase-like protein